MDEATLAAHTSSIIEPLLVACRNLNGPPVVRVPTKTLDYLRLDRFLEAHGFFVVRVDTVPIQSKADLLLALYLNAGFPGYFGFNWDALADCLSDFSWRPATGYALIVRHPESIASVPWSVFLDIVWQTSQEWAQDGQPFKLLLPAES